ncbi:MAG: single-stranded DNA-binding protein [Planctomycetes bacterium]|nr:single-stranded DNA-binding protein [Planctomycetota bacterium]
MNLRTITSTLVDDIEALSFNAPVAYTYNPLVYAREPYDDYLDHYGQGTKEVVLVGMNPGPWGMAQTGIPFGEVPHVRNWLGITGRVTTPENVHPKRPIQGFDCARSEVSGRRLWGWAKDTFKTPEAFFERFFVFNYCPLAFFDKDSKNITPDKLKATDRTNLFAPCNTALASAVEIMQPNVVVGIGNFAAARVKEACQDLPVTTGRITHPSPANPKANKGWAALIESELRQLGLNLPR